MEQVKYSNSKMPEKYALKWHPAITPRCKGGFQPMLGSTAWEGVKLVPGLDELPTDVPSRNTYMGQ